MASEGDVEVPDPEHPRIVADETFAGEPRTEGRRISVLDVYDGVRGENGELRPEEFAETFELDLADVYAALAYYHAHEDVMDRFRRARERASDALRDRAASDRPAGVGPDG